MLHGRPAPRLRARPCKMDRIRWEGARARHQDHVQQGRVEVKVTMRSLKNTAH